MYSWFHQSNFGSFTAGGQGATGAQGVTGFSPVSSKSIVVPYGQTSVADQYEAGENHMVNYKVHVSSGTQVASSTVDVLESPSGIRHNMYAELGTTHLYSTEAGLTGGSVLLLVRNQAATDITVTFLKTVV